MFHGMTDPNEMREALLSGLTADRSRLPGHLGLEVVELEHGRSRLRMGIERHHLAHNGYLHAGSVVTLADTTAGFGCIASLPEGAMSMTTIELKVNFLGTVTEGTLVSVGTLAHAGRSTQVWDVEVSDESSGKVIALFRCTQFILYPRT